MGSLSDERIRRLHEQFCEVAQRYPYLFFSMLTPLYSEGKRTWPQLVVCLRPGDVECGHLGLTPDEWGHALGRWQPVCPMQPFDTCWLQIDGGLWEARSTTEDTTAVAVVMMGAQALWRVSRTCATMAGIARVSMNPTFGTRPVWRYSASSRGRRHAISFWRSPLPDRRGLGGHGSHARPWPN